METSTVAWPGPVDPELPPPSAPPVRPAVAAAVVAVGGASGAVTRAVLTQLDTGGDRGWPWATLLVNLSGSFAIAVLMVVLLARSPATRLPRLFLGTGFLGGYTTFSALTVDAVELASAGRVTAAFAYVAATVAGSLLACLVGVGAARVGLSARPPVGAAS